jgi:dihydroorotate dehydrogenase electron transfer subunit
MQIAHGSVDEIYINGWRAARILCPPALIPAPGQYVLAQTAPSADSPLPVSVCMAATSPNGFYAADPLPVAWTPGTTLALKGPLGRGFQLPATARRVLLASWSGSLGRVLSLLEACQRQGAEVALIAESAPEGIPFSVEVLPPAALSEAAHWADYAALDMPREQIESRLASPPLSESLPLLSGYTQVLIETPVPCGGMADCGVCAVSTRNGVRLACKDGPVFDLKEILGNR